MKPPSPIHDIMQAYYSDTATPEQIDALEAWLREDPANVRWFVDLGLLDGLMLSVQKDEDAAAVLATLAEAEANAEPDFSLLRTPAFEAKPNKPEERPITFSDFCSVAAYLTAKGLRTKAGMIGSIAATLILGTLLYLTIFSLGTSQESPEIVDNTPAKPAASTESTPRGSERQLVATLTAQHNATWAGGPASVGPRIGDTLNPNTRLTLTAGFAEITTARGAIAILQAPATIELLDNNNAIRLHAGKLVGICETESSKGFVVRTPHMDVTDLGTRFGVDVSQDDATEVHVFEGEVRAVRPGAKPLVLYDDESAQASASSSSLTAIDHSPDRFAAIRSVSGRGAELHNKGILETDTAGTPWLIATSEQAGSVTFNGNIVACSVDQSGFTRGVVGGMAYGFIQHRAKGAGEGKPATATGTWTFSNLPAGRYDIATSFKPDEASFARYNVNGTEVLLDQSTVPAANAGPTFDHGLRLYRSESDVVFTRIGSSIVVAEGGSITITIDNANVPADHHTLMDSVAITLVPEAGQD